MSSFKKEFSIVNRDSKQSGAVGNTVSKNYDNHKLIKNDQRLTISRQIVRNQLLAIKLSPEKSRLQVSTRNRCIDQVVN